MQLFALFRNLLFWDFIAFCYFTKFIDHFFFSLDKYSILYFSPMFIDVELIFNHIVQVVQIGLCICVGTRRHIEIRMESMDTPHGVSIIFIWFFGGGHVGDTTWTSGDTARVINSIENIIHIVEAKMRKNNGSFRNPTSSSSSCFSLSTDWRLENQPLSLAN